MCELWFACKAFPHPGGSHFSGNLFNAAWLDDPAEKPFCFEIFLAISALLMREHRTECAAFLKTLRCYHENHPAQHKNTRCPTLVNRLCTLLVTFAEPDLHCRESLLNDLRKEAGLMSIRTKAFCEPKA